MQLLHHIPLQRHPVWLLHNLITPVLVRLGTVQQPSSLCLMISNSTHDSERGGVQMDLDGSITSRWPRQSASAGHPAEKQTPGTHWEMKSGLLAGEKAPLSFAVLRTNCLSVGVKQSAAKPSAKLYL